MPPNQILIGLALFLTLFTMAPVLSDINENALQPLSAGEIGVEEAFTTGLEPVRQFMLDQVEDADISLFYRLADMTPTTIDETPNRVLMPAFLLGELTKGFKTGVILFLPFLVIDMVVASVLMAMGMMMLPPAMISLPFKILLFVMVNGWNVVMETVFMTFK
jgi:flagellar biosynthetic protein FliP